MKIALVSDTHVPSSLARLPATLLDRLDRESVDAILHAGDIVRLNVIEELNRIATTTAVAGNMDPPEVTETLPDRAILRLGGRTIGLQHGHQRHALQDRYIGLGYDTPEMDLFYQAMATQLPDAEIIVFGHFHVPVVKRWNDRLFVNPGSVAPTNGRSTFALLDLGAEIHAHIVELGNLG
jgi:putative phosphoesterase